MMMRNLKRISVVALALVITLVSFSGCSSNLTWSYKDGNTVLAPGVYIYNLYMSYYQAYSSVGSSDTDVLAQEIDDPENEGQKINAKEFVLRDADYYTRQLLTVDRLFKEKGLEITAEDRSSLNISIDAMWSYYGPTFETYGISKESFAMADSENSFKAQELFNAIYDEGGEKAVPADELKKYFEENYASYSYINISLAPLSESTDSETGEATTTGLTDEQITEAKSKFAAYADLINKEGKTIEEVEQVYVTDYALETIDESSGEAKSYVTSNVEVLENSSLSDELKEELKGLENGKAKFVTTGEESSASGYLIVKHDITEETEEYMGEEKKSQVLGAMKNEEFNDYLKQQTNDYTGYTKNDAVINKYQPSMFVATS